MAILHMDIIPHNLVNALQFHVLLRSRSRIDPSNQKPGKQQHVDLQY